MEIKTLDDLRSALARVIDYSWAAEETDYVHNTLPEDRDGHIFEDLKAIDSWLKPSEGNI